MPRQSCSSRTPPRNKPQHRIVSNTTVSGLLRLMVLHTSSYRARFFTQLGTKPSSSHLQFPITACPGYRHILAGNTTVSGWLRLMVHPDNNLPDTNTSILHSRLDTRYPFTSRRPDILGPVKYSIFRLQFDFQYSCSVQPPTVLLQ